MQNTANTISSVVRKMVKSLFALILAFGLMSTAAVAVSGNGLAANNTEPAVADSAKVYEIVDEMPEMEGGIAAIYKYIKYPHAAVAGKVEGRVFIKFVVTEEGKATNATILKDIGAGCGKAAIAGLKKVKFKPGKLNGKPVKVYYTLPVNFKIDG